MHHMQAVMYSKYKGHQKYAGNRGAFGYHSDCGSMNRFVWRSMVMDSLVARAMLTRMIYKLYMNISQVDNKRLSRRGRGVPENDGHFMQMPLQIHLNVYCYVSPTG